MTFAIGKRWLLYGIAMATLIVSVGFAQSRGKHSGQVENNRESESHQTGPAVRDLASNYNRFGWDLLSQLIGEKQTGNIFVSPASVALALSMVLNGADGATADEIAQALGTVSEDLPTVNAAADSMMQQLDNPEEKVQLSIANSLWLNNQFTFKQPFLTGMSQAYHARIEGLSFSDASVTSKINAWVSDATHDRIPKIIDALSPQDIAIIINAVYFKGMWTNKFDTTRTFPEDFHLLDGSVDKRDLMHASRKFEYFENDSRQMVALPYGAGRFRMVVLLPAEGVDYAAFLRSLTADRFAAWSNHLFERKGEVGLPKFRLEWERKLNGPLQQIGVVDAFDGSKADLTRMCEPTHGINAYIGEVLQKTFLDVNESGTEAAAATAIGIMATSVDVDVAKPFRMIVDRPFFITIEDSRTGLILFMGAIANPPKPS